MRQRHAAQNKEPAADIAATVRMNVNSLGWSAGLGTPQWLHQLTHPADAPEGSGLAQNVMIDLMKGLTPIVILAYAFYRTFINPIAGYSPWNEPTVWTYWGIHGCYGLLWVMKGWTGFGDGRWQARKPFWYSIMLMMALMLYWIPIFIIIEGQVRAPAWLCGLCMFMFGTGVFWHFASDMQKTEFLAYRQSMTKLNAPEGTYPRILTTRLWSFSRNPNYFGELLIYSSFCLLSMHWLPPVWLVSMVTLYWLPSMRLKDKSLSRFGAEWESYKQKTAFFIPYVW